MVSSDKNKFIKQHIELYGEEIFLNSSSFSTYKGFSKSSKKSLLFDLETNLDFNYNQNNNGLNNKQVFGSGDVNADLVIIGESPDDYEDESGKPFVGPSGKLLDKILKAIGLKRNKNVYLTYILKYKTPENRDPLLLEINESLPILMKQLEIIQPKIIVGLGKVVGRAFLNIDSTLEDMRNDFYDFNSYPFKITYCLETLLRDPSLKKNAWEDFQFVRDFLKT